MGDVLAHLKPSLDEFSGNNKKERNSEVSNPKVLKDRWVTTLLVF